MTGFGPWVCQKTAQCDNLGLERLRQVGRSDSARAARVFARLAFINDVSLVLAVLGMLAQQRERPRLSVTMDRLSAT